MSPEDPRPQDDPLLGATLGGRVLEARLGDGGMGVVYRAADPEGGPPVALKVLHPHLTQQAQVFARFEREARLGMQIDDPRVVRTLEIGQVDARGIRTRFLTMEYVEGQTLRQLLDELGRVPEALCLHIALEVAGALGSIHGAGIVHRDIKPENVLITPANEIKVMDLGVARLEDDAAPLSRTGQFVGSLLYAAPEQLEAKPRIHHRVDLWALGVTLYELATGVQPFAADGIHAVIQRILGHEPPPPSQHQPSLSAFFDRLVGQLLEKTEAGRIGDAGVLAEAIQGGVASTWWRTETADAPPEDDTPRVRLGVARLTSCHGRDAEQTRLALALERARERGIQAVLIEGEAGVGKTRLVDAFLAATAGTDPAPAVLYGAAAAGGAATPHGALADAIRSGIPEGRLRETLRVHLAEAHGLVEPFAALLEDKPPPAGASALTPGALGAVFAQVLRSLSAKQPLLVVLDELHRLPPGGLGLVAGLLNALTEAPVCLLLLAREGLDAAWIRDLEETGRVDRLALPRLSPEAVRALLDELFGGDLVVHDLAAPLMTRSDGNPRLLFAALEQIRESGRIDAPPQGPWRSGRGTLDLDALHLPDSARDLLLARVAELPAEDRELLEAAACAGRRFEPDVLVHALELKRLDVLRRLGRLERTHRLLQADGRAYRFDPPQLAEALLSETPPLTREALHAALADALETLLAEAGTGAEGRRSERGYEIVRHRLAAGDGARAKDDLMPVVTFLIATYRHEAANRLLADALAVDGLLVGKERVAFLHERAAALGHLGRRQEAHEVLGQVFEHAADSPQACARTLSRQAWHHYVARELDEARLKAEQCLDLSIEGGFAAQVATAQHLLGIIAMREGRFAPAERRLRIGLDIARSVAADTQVLQCLTGLGNVHVMQGRTEDANRYFEEGLARAREIGNRTQEHTFLGSLAYGHYLRGDFDAAESLVQRSLAIAQEIGYRSGQAHAHGNLASILMHRGRYADAESHLDRQRRIGEETNQLESRISGLEGAALIRVRVGDHVRAGTYFEKLRRLTQGNPRRHAIAQEYEALLAADEGRTDDALRLMDNAVVALREHRFRAELADALIHRAGLLLRFGRADQTGPVFREARELAEAQENTRVLALCLAYEVLAANGDPESARAHLAENRDRLPLDECAEVAWTLWRATGDRALVEEAHAVLEDIAQQLGEADRETFWSAVPRNREIREAAAQGM